MKRIFVGIGIILALAGTITAEAMELVPLEFRDIPVNGNDLVADPEAVTVQYGFSTRAGSKVVEHGDSICLLDSFRWIETPHVDWATPFANGPVRVLYIASQAYTTRNPIELAQRSDFDLTILQVPGVLSDGPLEQMPAVHAYFREKFTKLLSQEYDVIVLGSSSLQKPVEYILHAIRDKVSAGCGLVCLHDGQQWWRTDKELLEFFQSLSPISFGYSGVNAVPQRTTVASPVTDSISFALWPPTGVHKGKVDEGAEALVQVNGFPIVAAGRLGKGRVVGVYFHYPLIPDVDPEKTPLFGDYYEPIYSFYLKAVAWAAGKEPQVRLSVPKTTICRSGENASVKVGVQARDNREHPTILEFRLQDPWGNPVSDGKMKCQAMASERQVDVALPQLLANGLYRLDLWLLDGKKVANWGSAAIRVEGGKSLSVEPLQKVGKVGDVARYKVNTGGATGTLHVRGVDDMDRVFHESTTDARDGSTVEVDLGRSCLPHNRVEFSLLNGKDVVARQYVDLWIPRVGLGSTADEFVLASYGWTREDTHLRRYAGALYREAGLNAIYSNWHSRGYIGEAGEMGLYSISGAMSPYLKQNNLEKELKSCPNKPESQAEWKKNIDQAIDDIQTYGGIGRVLDDEAWFGYVTYQDGAMQGAQACQCAHCMRLFREEMQRRYGDLVRLNAVWDTNFKSFEEVRCIEEEEIINKDNPSGWLEFRQYMNWTYATKYYGWINEQHAPLGKDYGAGCGAPFWTSREGGPTYKGGDFSVMKDSMRFMMAYGGPEARQFRDAYVGQPGGQKYDPPLEWRQHGPWFHLLNGADALWFYYGSQLIGQELAHRQHAMWMQEGTADIRDGVGNLISRAEPVDKQVRILYSSENDAMAWLYAKRTDAWNALRIHEGKFLGEQTLQSLLDDFLFLQTSYITADQIRAGELQDCKLLVLPQSFNMDDDTAKSIAAFVRTGGCVLADFMPATRQQYGKPRPKSALGEVFGVDASKSKIHKEDEPWYSVGVNFGDAADGSFSKELIWLPSDLTFAGLKATTSRPQGKMLSKKGVETETCFVNNYGKGKALLLNFMYRDLDAETSGWHRMFGKALAEWARLEPPAQIVHPFTKAPLPYRPLRAFRRGEATLLGCIRGRMVWSGGRPVLIDESRSLDTTDRATLLWQEKRHAYNVRTGKYLGYGTSAEINLPSYHGRLLALLPYKVESVRIECPAHAKSGGSVTLIAQAVASGGKPGEHVFRMEVTSPTGCTNVLYCKTKTAPNGKAEFTIPFANNDRVGKWTIQVRDVMTGVEGKAALQLKA